MTSYFLVETCRGPSWKEELSRREQPGWAAHATIMDALVEEGVIVLGGPVGDLDGDEALLVLDVASEDDARRRLSSDPWLGGVLSLRGIRPWTIWLRPEAPTASP